MRSEWFLVFEWGSGGGTVFVPVSGMRAFTVVHARSRSRGARCAVPLGLAWMGVVRTEICAAVPWGLVVGVLCPIRCALRIGLYQGVWWVGG